MNGIEVFAPHANSPSVATLRRLLRLNCAAIKVRVCPDPSARERDCFVTVRDKVDAEGGAMRLGWAVWQHGRLFIEGEFHAVYDPGNSRPWIDLTPRPQRTEEVLFLLDEGASYDFDSTDVVDNRRVALIPISTGRTCSSALYKEDTTPELDSRNRRDCRPSGPRFDSETGSL